MPSRALWIRGRHALGFGAQFFSPSRVFTSILWRGEKFSLLCHLISFKDEHASVCQSMSFHQSSIFLGEQHGLSAVVGLSCSFWEARAVLLLFCSSENRYSKHMSQAGSWSDSPGSGGSQWVGGWPLLSFKSHFEYRYRMWQWFLKGFGWPVHFCDVFWVFGSSFLELALSSPFKLSLCCLSWLCVWDGSIHGLGELCFLQEPDRIQSNWNRHLVFRWARSDCCSDLSGVRRLCTSPQALS